LKCIFSVISICICFNLSAQSFEIKNRIINSDEDLLHCTAYTKCYKQKNDSAFFLQGTSYFFYSIKAKKIFLILNKHLIKGTSEIKILLDLKVKRNKEDFLDASEFSINLNPKTILYFDDYDLDLCLIKLEGYTDSLSKYFFKCFTENNLPSENDIDQFSFRDELYSIGYSSGVFDKYHNIPFVLRGYFSTLPKYNYMGSPYFVMNCSNRNGGSGSPVVLYKNSKYFLTGTVVSVDASTENIYETDSLKYPYEPNFLGQVDSLLIDAAPHKIKPIIKDYFNISYVIKSSVISLLIGLE
jgi:hypothetical protein